MEENFGKTAHELNDLINYYNNESQSPDFNEKLSNSTLNIQTDKYNMPYDGLTGNYIKEEIADRLVYYPYNNNCWIDFKKAEENNLSLKPDEKIFVLKDGDKELHFVNFEQLDEQSKEKINLKPDNPNATKNWTNISEIDEYIDKQGIEIYKNSFDTGFNSLNTNRVHVIPDDQLKSDKQHYRMVFHEIAHSTSEELGRKKVSASGKEDLDFCKEELVADFTAYKLCKKFGVEDKLGSGHYFTTFINKAIDSPNNGDINDVFKYAIVESTRAFELIDKRGQSLELNQSYNESENLKNENLSLTNQASEPNEERESKPGEKYDNVKNNKRGSKFS